MGLDWDILAVLISNLAVNSQPWFVASLGQHRVSYPEGPYTLPMELGPQKNHPYFGFGDLIP